MVRAGTNEPVDDKKDSTKKKTTTRKKTVVTGVWPCKINGCNKQFAREADLKRHQRTTKSHSVPGFACPQCDATFTRTDALRRHQKSRCCSNLARLDEAHLSPRHNGVVIEPSEQDTKEQTEDGSSATQSKSRSTTPSLKGKERAAVVHTQPPAQTSRSGPSSYYRQHTATTTSPYPLRPAMNPHYQISLPTSSTRSDVAPNWAYPQPWASSTQMGYQPMYYPPHYRPNGTVPPPGQLPGPLSHQRAPQSAPSPQAQQRDTPVPLQPTSNDTNPTTNNYNSSSGGESSSVPIIDPSLHPSDDTTLTEEQVLEITQAAVEAMLEAEAECSQAQKRAASSSTMTIGGNEGNEDLLLTRKIDNNPNTMNGYGPPLERPEPMEHMLTEDGEPMLNPAELLTQESLASPPPS